MYKFGNISFIVGVMLIIILLSGCINVSPVINNTTPIPAQGKITPRPNLVSLDTRTVNGHVLMDSYPVADVPVVAVSSDGSDSLQTTTDANGSFILNIRPNVQYNATAIYNGVKRTIFPIFLHESGEASSGRKDVSDNYDIILTNGHNATIAGNTGWGFIIVNATPVDGGQSLTTVSNTQGWYSLDLQPGIAYRLTGRDYYEQMRLSLVTFYARNSDISVTNDIVTVDPDETILIDMSAIRPI